MSAEASAGSGPQPAVLRLRDFAALRVSGDDRVEFLQGQLSQDLAKLTPSQAAPAAWCNRQGRVLCLTVALEWKDAIFLVLPADMAETFAVGLQRYVLRARVRIRSAEEPVFGWVPYVNEGVAALRKGTINGFPAAPWACAGGARYCGVRLPGHDPRALLLGEPPAAPDAPRGSNWTVERWRLADIRAEIPWVSTGTSGRFLAHSLNLDLSGTVSFTKGCYVGQEIIARMEHRGRPKRRMRRLRLPPGVDPHSGAKVEHPELGAVTIIGAAHAGEEMEVLAEVRLARKPPNDGESQ